VLSYLLGGLVLEFIELNLTSSLYTPTISIKREIHSVATSNPASVFIFRMPGSLSTTCVGRPGNWRKIEQHLLERWHTTFAQYSIIEGKVFAGTCITYEAGCLAKANVMITNVLLPLPGQLSHCDLHICERPKTNLHVYVESVCNGHRNCNFGANRENHFGALGQHFGAQSLHQDWSSIEIKAATG